MREYSERCCAAAVGEEAFCWPGKSTGVAPRESSGHKSSGAEEEMDTENSRLVLANKIMKEELQVILT